jgi:xanthine dehydrogenase YagR molybdenum-binding subunit
MNPAVLGQGIVRKDGLLKVTGRAAYASDNRLPRMAYAALVGSTIPAGRIARLDTGAALAAPGVIAVVTHENAPRLHSPGSLVTGGEFAEHFFPLQDPHVYFWGQCVAVVVADTLERAEDAAGRVRIDYTPSPFETDMEDHPTNVYEPSRYLVTQKLQLARGDIDAGLAAGEVVVKETYRTPHLNHNPMEPHATVADWTEEKLTIYEPTQWVMGLRAVVSKSFDLKPEKVHIISPFVGGGFGGKGFSWPHTLAAAMASREAGRPVKLVLSRAELFTSVGHRGPTRQEMVLAATRDGRLTGVQHATLTSTSINGNYVESCGLATAMLYACPNVKVIHRAARLNTGTPCPMRAPGEAPGLFALESAMDELAIKLGIDPIELRIRNHADEDPEKEKPWSSKHLLECYRRGAELFGWERRQTAPGSMQEQGELVGLGMATATYPANRRDGSAAVRIYADGRVVVRSATHDLGTGTYTTLAQVAADELDVPIEKVSCELGDSTLPKASVSGGSSTSASVGPLVQEAARALKKKLAGFVSVAAAVQKSGEPYLEAQAEHGALAAAAAQLFSRGPSAHSFGAHFAEVRIDPITRQIRVSRVVAVIDGGKIMNSLTARSQIQGGIVWGIGMALLERTAWDARTGTPVTRNLADYLVPVNADVPEITVEFTNIPDLQFNSLGVRGIGEIGITGITAAIANAVYHATGVRVRDLPITLDKIMV